MALRNTSSIHAGISRSSSSTRLVLQLALRRARARLRNFGAERQPPGQHLVGDDAQRKQVRARVPLSPRKYSGAVYCSVPSISLRSSGESISEMPATRVEPKSMIFTVPVAIDHHVLRPQVLVQHLQAVERQQAVGDLLDDAAHGFDRRLRVVDEPLMQGLAVDELGHRV